MRNRWRMRGAVCLLLAGWADASAQNPPSAATVPAALAQARPAPAAAPAGDSAIVRMRTAGQPDRQLKVLRVTSYTEGESVAEVQDVQTGQTFTLPGKVVAMLPKEAANAAPPVAAPPTPVVRPTPAVVEKPVPKPTPAPEAQPQPKVLFLPPPAPEPKAEPKAEIAPAVAAPIRAPGASLVWRPRVGEAPALTPAPLEPSKTDRWLPMRRFNAVPPQSLAPSLRTIARGTSETGHEIEDGPPAVRLIRPTIVEERVELVPVSYRSVEVQIRDEVQGYVYELGSALRPSVRENAAICLAEGRFGSRREVKTVLAKAAVADPAPSVRAACIELLLKLGYHDPEYMAYLQSASVPGAGPTLVRAAAKDALAKLTPRN